MTEGMKDQWTRAKVTDEGLVMWEQDPRTYYDVDGVEEPRTPKTNLDPRTPRSREIQELTRTIEKQPWEAKSHWWGSGDATESHCEARWCTRSWVWSRESRSKPRSPLRPTGKIRDQEDPRRTQWYPRRFEKKEGLWESLAMQKNREWGHKQCLVVRDRPREPLTMPSGSR